MSKTKDKQANKGELDNETVGRLSTEPAASPRGQSMPGISRREKSNSRGVSRGCASKSATNDGGSFSNNENGDKGKLSQNGSRRQRRVPRCEYFYLQSEYVLSTNLRPMGPHTFFDPLMTTLPYQRNLITDELEVFAVDEVRPNPFYHGSAQNQHERFQIINFKKNESASVKAEEGVHVINESEKPLPAEEVTVENKEIVDTGNKEEAITVTVYEAKNENVSDLSSACISPIVSSEATKIYDGVKNAPVVDMGVLLSGIKIILEAAKILPTQIEAIAAILKNDEVQHSTFTAAKIEVDSAGIKEVAQPNKFLTQGNSFAAVPVLTTSQLSKTVKEVKAENTLFSYQNITEYKKPSEAMPDKMGSN